MSGSAAPSTEEFIELINAEQYVDIQKLRDFARHGVQPAVRGEVWLYLLGVLSDDKSQEMTSVRSKYIEYDSMEKHNVLYEKRIRREAVRYYQRNLIPRPPPGRTMARSSRRFANSDVKKHDSSTRSTSKGVKVNKKINSHGLETTANSSTMASLSDGGANAIAAATSNTRGPNRADNGRTRVLAGIMGDLDPQRLNDSDDVLIDPEAAAAHEMKRFCQAVEHIVCAHLNRWKWCAADGTVTLVEAEIDREEEQDEENGVDPETLSSRAERSNVRDETIDEDMVGDSNKQAARSQNALKSTIGKQSAQVPSVLSSLPKEYAWAHQQMGGGNLDTRQNVIRQVDARPSNVRRESLQLSKNGYFIQPEYHPDLITLCSPLVKCIRSEAGIFFAFEKLMSMVEEHNALHPLPARIATFLTLFRTTLPDLYAYFDEEEVDVIGLASAWMRHLLAAEMRIEDLLRLWDTYFAVPDPLDLHMYVCIAILTNFNDALEELDQSEAKGMLFSLPPLDVDRIVNEAINIRLAHRQSEMLSNDADDDDE